MASKLKGGREILMVDGVTPMATLRKPQESIMMRLGPLALGPKNKFHSDPHPLFQHRTECRRPRYRWVIYPKESLNLLGHPPFLSFDPETSKRSSPLLPTNKLPFFLRMNDGLANTLAQPADSSIRMGLLALSLQILVVQSTLSNIVLTSVVDDTLLVC